MSALIRRIEYSREAGDLMLDITGQPDLHGPGIRRLFMRGPIWIIARRWVIGTGPVPDHTGRVRIHRRHGHAKVVTRPRAARIPKGHPWRRRPSTSTN